MFGDSRFNGLCIRAIDNIYLLSIDKVMERGNRSYSFSFHEFGRLWSRITNDLKQHGLAAAIGEKEVRIIIIFEGEKTFA